MTNATSTMLACYHDRMRRARDHIDLHLDDPLDLARVSAVAAFSPAHFHRQFNALFGISVHRYIQLARFRRAAFHLAYKDDSITQIAFDAGYETPEAFARAFRSRAGQTPSSFRKSPDWMTWEAACTPLDEARSTLMAQHFSKDAITIRSVGETRIAIMTHTGNPADIGQSIRRFITWRRANGLSPQNSATYTLFHDDPQTTPPALYRLSLCVGTDKPVAALGETIEIGCIPAGRCAVLHVTGTIDRLEDAATLLYRDWLPRSGEEIRDFPLYCQRLHFYPEVPEHEAVAELFLPLT
ncbi:AraC family transcriptional regulator [Asaia sp. BMEF1]|uniref:AraC family transcriptional regulator n=1 Tax=Asaia sp. BMEF1 TaxID=3155932 RepID=UPI003F67990E